MPGVRRLKKSKVKEREISDVFRYIHEEVGPRRTALQRAIVENDPLDAILELMSEGGLNEQNDNGFTALHLAVLRSKPIIVRTLILFGADPKIQTLRNNTAMHFACHRLDIDCIKALADAVAEGETSVPVNFEMKNDDGLTALHIAAIRGDAEIVRYLMKRGAEIETRYDPTGDTALHLAVRYNRTRVIYHFVKNRRSSLVQRNAYHQLPFQLAIRLKRMDIARKLFVVKRNA